MIQRKRSDIIMDNQTIAEKFVDAPFAMLNWHRNWCEKQEQYHWCIEHGIYGSLDQKRKWEKCPNREICFLAFINSNVELK